MGTDNPLVTVVIPTYNRLQFLMQAVNSVLNQSYNNWELIIADDGSTDGTSVFIRSINDPRIRLLELPHTGNIAWLRNMGAQSGKGKWISFLDSDDIWLPRRLEIQLNMFQNSKARWGFGRFEHMNERLQSIPAKAGEFFAFNGWIAKEVVSTTAAVAIGTLMIERNLFEEVGGFNTDHSLIYREDYDLVLRLALKAEAVSTDELMVLIREHPGRSTNQLTDSHERTAESLQRFLLLQPGEALKKIARKRRGYHLAEAATFNIARKKYLPAIRQLSLALINGDTVKHLLSAVNRGIQYDSKQLIT